MSETKILPLRIVFPQFRHGAADWNAATTMSVSCPVVSFALEVEDKRCRARYVCACKDFSTGTIPFPAPIGTPPWIHNQMKEHAKVCTSTS